LDAAPDYHAAPTRKGESILSKGERIFEAIMRRINGKGKHDVNLYQDAFDTLKLIESDTGRVPTDLSKELRSTITTNLPGADTDTMLHMFSLNKELLLYEAPHVLDSFMLYLEINRAPEEQFWLPRRSKLMPVCEALQDLETGDLQELFLSCPPRVGKSTLMVFFLAWVIGRDPERSNLYSSYTDSVVKPIYTGLLEIFTDNVTYQYFSVFPNRKLVHTDSKDYLINMDRRKRYASFTGRSLYGSLNGSCDSRGYVIADDLISGIEEALSPSRLQSAWNHVDNNLLTRAKENAKRLWIGTRWSLSDPQGIRQDILENDPAYADVKWKVLNVPALDENDESNFEYLYGVGFTTDFYIQRRASFERRSDMASWLAQYQGVPVERDGAIFEPSQLRYYNGVLPDDVEPDRVIMVIDPAWGGGDFCSAPICYQYDEDIYVADVVFSDADKSVTQPLVVNAIKKHDVAAVKVEGSKMTGSYGEDIDKALKAEGIYVNLRTNTKHFTGTGKRVRILDKAPDIREHMVFLAEGSRPKMYAQFMQNLYSFTVGGKVKHDDAADSLAMVMDFVNAPISKMKIMHRPW
jgi:predicted phage terminase large subunit-like protein